MDSATAAALAAVADDPAAGEGERRRARIVLLAGAGVSTAAIAEQLGCSRQTVVTWRERYRAGGLAALADEARSGRPPAVDPTLVIIQTLRPPPPGHPRWTVRSLAAELGVSSTVVADTWRTWGVAPEVGGLTLLTEPVLDDLIVDIVGLYADADVRMLALTTAPRDSAGPGSTPAVALERRPGLGRRLCRLQPLMGTDGDRGVFAARVREVPGVRAVVAAHEIETAQQHWPHGRLEVAAPARWNRVARVACLLAGATARGAASVTALRQALDRHSPDEHFCWVR